MLKNETRFRAVQEEAKQKNQQLKLLDELLHIQDDRFESFTQTCQQLLQESKEFVSSGRLDQDKRLKLMRSLHTFKGVSRSLNLSELANAVHEAEDILVNPGENFIEELRKKSESIRNVLERYVEFAQKKMGRSHVPAHIHDERIQIVDACLVQLAQIQGSVEPKPLKSKIEWVEHRLLESVGKRLDDVLGPLLDGLDSLSNELRKPAPSVRFKVSYPVYFLPFGHQTLLTVFTHLLRNSMDHGIEMPDDRLKKGKPLQGQMVIEVSSDQNWVYLVFADDGRGLNLARIRERAVKAGLISEGSQLTRLQIAELIFQNGFSTAESVSQISGRGVGLDAVRSELEEHGGSISIQFSENRPGDRNQSGDFVEFSFQITVPSNFARSLAPVLAS